MFNKKTVSSTLYGDVPNFDTSHTSLSIIEWLAIFAFLISTLGFLTYETGVRLGVSPQFLGGYIGIVTVSLAPVTLLSYFGSLGTVNNKFTGADAYLLFITFVVGSVAAVHLDSEDFASDVAQSHLVTVAQFVNFFFIYKLFPLNNKLIRNFMIFSVMASSVMLYDANLGSLVAGDNRIDIFGVADYQQFAIYYLMIIMIGAAIINHSKTRVVLYAVGIIVLFYNGARTEFLGWLLAISAIEVVKSRKTFSLMLFALVIIFPLFGFISSTLAEYLPENRVTSLIENSTQDQSYTERQEILDQALITIYNNPITGDYARYEVGRYAHNALSIWQDFGIIPFFVFIISLISALMACFRGYRQGLSDKEHILFAAIIAVSIIFFMFSKAFSHPLYPAAMAMHARYQMRQSRLASQLIERKIGAKQAQF